MLTKLDDASQFRQAEQFQQVNTASVLLFEIKRYDQQKITTKLHATRFRHKFFLTQEVHF